MRRRFGVLRIAAAAAAFGLLAACGGGGGGDTGGAPATLGETPTTTAPDQVKKGGHLDALLPVTATLVTNLDPVRLQYKSGGGSAAWYPWAIYSGLLMEDPLSGVVEPVLAESFETTDGGTTWELRLREGLKFSDGTPLDAEAVKFNWDRIADPANAALAQRAIETWESWTVTDPRTVTIKLAAPNLQMPRSIAVLFSAIGSPTAITRLGEDFGAQPVGPGAFKVDKFQPGTSLTVSKNPEYFDAPRPYLDSITFKAMADEDQRLRSFQAGEADFSLMLRPTDMNRLEELDAHAVVTSAAIFSGYAMNTKKPPFDDIRVRRAFVLATDRSILCQARNAGQPCGETIPVPDWPFPPGTPLHDPSVKFPAVDVTEAQRLIDDYLADSGSTSVDVQLTTVSGAQIALDIAQAVKSQLDQLNGVDVTIEQAGGDFGTNLAKGEYAMSVFSISDAYPYPTLHEWFQTGGTLNAVTGYTSDTFDDLLGKALAAETPTAAAGSYNEFAKALIDQALLIPYSYTTYGLAGRNSLRDIIPHADQGVRWEMLWLDSDG